MFDLFVTSDLVRKQTARQFEAEPVRTRVATVEARPQRRRPAIAARVLRALASVAHQPV